MAGFNKEYRNCGNGYYYLLINDDTFIGAVPVKKGTLRNITPVADGTIPVLLKKGGRSQISQEIELSESLNAPINAGDIIGYVHVKYENEEIGAIPITAAETSEKLTVWFALRKLYRKLFSL